jgi:hypothetical protein
MDQHDQVVTQHLGEYPVHHGYVRLAPHEIAEPRGTAPRFRARAACVCRPSLPSPSLRPPRLTMLLLVCYQYEHCEVNTRSAELLDLRYARSYMSRHATRDDRRIPVRAVQARVGASERGQGTQGLPQVPQPVLEHAAPKRPPQGRPARVEANTWLDHRTMGSQRTLNATRRSLLLTAKKARGYKRSQMPAVAGSAVIGTAHRIASTATSS